MIGRGRVSALAGAALAIVATASAGSARAQAKAPARVAVVIDLLADVTPERASALGQALADALARELDVDTIGGGDVARRMPPGGLPDDCLATPACVSDLGARLDANQLLFLAIADVAGQVRIDPTWVDVASGQAVSRPRIELDADTRAAEVFAAAAARLLPDAPRRVDEAQHPSPGPRHHMTTTTWAIAGASAVALGGGIALGLSAKGTYDRCDRDPDSCDSDTRDGIRTRAMLADGLMAAGLVGAGVVTFLYLRSSDRREAPAAQTWLVTPTRHGALAGVRVDF